MMRKLMMKQTHIYLSNISNIYGKFQCYSSVSLSPEIFRHDRFWYIGKCAASIHSKPPQFLSLFLSFYNYACVTVRVATKQFPPALRDLQSRTGYQQVHNDVPLFRYHDSDTLHSILPGQRSDWSNHRVHFILPRNFLFIKLRLIASWLIQSSR